MTKLRPLINGQIIRIDNHARGKPILWNWQEGEKPNDIHLDKTLKDKVNNKVVRTRITLNNDQGVDVPKKFERKDREWKKAYDKMVKEVHDTLQNNKDVRHQLVNDVIVAIKEIGPNKENRAVRKALKRIANHFDLPEGLFLQYKELTRGTVALYLDEKSSQQYYVGFGLDYAFYLGEGDGRSFTRRVHGWHKKAKPYISKQKLNSR